MTTDIDALSGRELNSAVANALGWIQDAKHSKWWTDSGGKSHRLATENEPSSWTGAFDPAHDIACAFELDGEGWEWTINEYIITSEYHWLRFAIYDNKNKCGPYEVRCDFPDFPTKAAAYATARCRAWLKAKQAEAAR